VRHPMYAYAVLLMIGAPLLLGSQSPGDGSDPAAAGRSGVRRGGYAPKWAARLSRIRHQSALAPTARRVVTTTPTRPLPQVPPADLDVTIIGQLPLAELVLDDALEPGPS